MKRVMIHAEKAAKYEYRDSLHAAIIQALRSGGAKEEDVIGRYAKPWTFAPLHIAKQGGIKILRGVTISTSDEKLGQVVARLKPNEIVWNSTNGDRIDMGEGKIVSFANPIDDSGELRVKFASPFVLSKPGSKGKVWLDNLHGVDLGEAFSFGLSKRLNRAVKLNVQIDSFTLKCMGNQPVIVKLRKAGKGFVTVRGFFATMNIIGEKRDLEDAYFGGLGQKTRYGFGLTVPAK